MEANDIADDKSIERRTIFCRYDGSEDSLTKLYDKL